MTRARLCDYHYGILTRGYGKRPHARTSKSERRRRAADIHMQCLDCQGKPRKREVLGRDRDL